jgi:hypothetical protein
MESTGMPLTKQDLDESEAETKALIDMTERVAGTTRTEASTSTRPTSRSSRGGRVLKL